MYQSKYVALLRAISLLLHIYWAATPDDEWLILQGISVQIKASLTSCSKMDEAAHRVLYRIVKGFSGGRVKAREPYLKSTCPGVSMRFKAYMCPSAALYRMRAWFSLMVIPRSRSRSIPSRNCA